MLPPDRPLDPAAREDLLRSVLAPARHAVVFAVNSAAVRVALPDDPVLAGTTPLPGETMTAVDFVRAEDRMKVVWAWEQAQAWGAGQCHVRLLSAPQQVLTFTIIDVRPSRGVFLAVLSAGTQEGAADDAGGPSGRPLAISDPSLLVPRRPRTATVHKNLNAAITDMDERTTGMFGYSREDMIGHRSLEFIHPDDHERAITQWMEMRSRQHTERIRLRHALKSGGWLWVEVENVFVGFDQPEQVVAIAHLTDISDEMAAYDAVRHREALFRRLADSLPVGVFQWDPEDRLVYANTRVTQMLGVPADVVTPSANSSSSRPASPEAPPDAVGDELTLDLLLAPIDAAGRAAIRAALRAAAQHGEDAELEIDLPALTDERIPGPRPAAAQGRWRAEIPPPAGHGRTLLFTVAALTHLEGAPGAIVTISDVTSAARFRHELQMRATHDPLTGCLNRDGILTTVDALLDPREAAESIALLFIDLDGFKHINDTFGHAVGDRVLRTAAERLRRLARQFDVVGRIGGDEFLVALPGVHDLERARHLAERIHDGLEGPVDVDVDDVEVLLAASIGVALARPGAGLAQALDAADHAMYQAKRSRSRVAASTR